MEDQFDAIAFGSPKIMEKIPEFRYISAEGGNYFGTPKLQQAWRDRDTGEIEWITVPTITVPYSEYYSA